MFLFRFLHRTYFDRLNMTTRAVSLSLSKRAGIKFDEMNFNRLLSL